MQRERIMLEVYVDLDPIPGAFHTKESAQHHVRRILNDSIEHYHPMVSSGGPSNERREEIIRTYLDSLPRDSDGVLDKVNAKDAADGLILLLTGNHR